jgi:hypothetical protein
MTIFLKISQDLPKSFLTMNCNNFLLKNKIKSILKALFQISLTIILILRYPKGSLKYQKRLKKLKMMICNWIFRKFQIIKESWERRKKDKHNLLFDINSNIIQKQELAHKKILLKQLKNLKIKKFSKKEEKKLGEICKFWMKSKQKSLK